jgi:hypothetical protein
VTSLLSGGCVFRTNQPFPPSLRVAVEFPLRWPLPQIVRPVSAAGGGGSGADRGSGAVFDVEDVAEAGGGGF